MNDPAWESGLCRDCLADLPAPTTRCPSCGSPRILAHPELHDLSIAHIDCDAFYASIEKRDNPAIRDLPVIVGGGHRGVVAAACYVARLYGVRSAMPMYTALKACPDAVVVRPNMAKYSAAGQTIRAIMRDFTPLVQPISIDEAFLDLSGTQRLHGASPAQSLARIVNRIEDEIGISASIGLSYNKFLAKVASDLDKPKGFAVIGRNEAVSFLATKPVGAIWGVGRALQATLRRQGVTTIGHLQRMTEADLVTKHGAMGRRLYHFSRGEDDRPVDPVSNTKSISSETTFADDIFNFDELRRRLWPLCEKVAERLKAKHVIGQTVTLKLKRADFRQVTRRHKSADPTQLAETIYQTAVRLLEPEATGPAFRLIGVGMSDLKSETEADQPDLLNQIDSRASEIEQAMDDVRAKSGPNAIIKGRSLI
ncbi:MAG: DNA polymerase IV [Rhodospirillaceae bacterium]|jgi:DNA polymerase IV|nr:DNA polymerase IV [Rhodospirillaceae bacterium]MBT5811296.1 DNA polymerase IV [Rhodospirillaceae bacterium]